MVSSMLPPDGGGAEAYVAALAAALRDRHDVLVLSGSAEAEVEGVRNVSLPHLPPVARDEGAAAKALWHLRDQWRPAVHRAIIGHLRAFAPDVVHTHQVQGLSAAPFTAVRALGVPHVHTAHDLNLLCLRTSMTRNGQPCGGRCRDCAVQRRVRGGAFRRHVTAMIGISDFITLRHVDAGVVPPGREVTIRHAAVPGEARLRTAAGAARLGFIGALAPHKGVRTLLEAFAGTGEGWSLAIAGRGELEGEVARAAAADARIDFLGQVAGEAKEAFFAGIDLLVVPSEWEEPSTLVGYEAAVRGIPSLAGDRGGLPELPEVTLFRAGDPDALRAGLEGAAEWLAARSGRLLERRGEFLWDAHVERVEAVLRAARA